MKNKITILCLLMCTMAYGQKKRVLFVGDSYTYRNHDALNDVPKMTVDMAFSAGDTLIVDRCTQDATSLKEHIEANGDINKINQGNWDYVVLQEKTYLPALKSVQTSVYPYVQQLNNTIKTYNPCAETVLYMTWARQDGLASSDLCPSNTWPYPCNYKGMDSLLNLRFTDLANINKAVLAPVIVVWDYIKKIYPGIDLYADANGHPKPAGIYIAACCFYTTLFRKDPTGITYNASLPDAVASAIRYTTKILVYDNLSQWHIGQYDPKPSFTYAVDPIVKQVTFNNTSLNAKSFLWDFGDGATSTDSFPTHTYALAGQYRVSLTVKKDINCVGIVTEQTITVTNSVYMKTGDEYSCSGTFYDEGGPDSDYKDAQNYKLIIKPNGATAVQMIFSQWHLHNRFDSLKIYNGTITSAANALKIWTGDTPLYTLPVIAPSGVMTIIFKSNSVNHTEGWKATWTSTGSCSPTVVNFSANSLTVNAGSTVQFTDLSDNNPTSWSWYFKGGIPERSNLRNPQVTYPTSGKYDVELIARNIAGESTKKRASYITVSPPVINMKSSVELSCSGTLYDDGGPGSNYLNGKTHILVIKPAGATSVSMNFSQWALYNNNDTLKIYDGINTSAPILGTHTTNSPGNVIATKGAMTLLFKSNQSGSAAGWKATWTSTGGTCAATITAATLNETTTDAASDVNIYPNPTDGLFTLSTSKKYDYFSIIDLVGKVIRDGNVTDKHFQINLNGYPAGIYLIQLKNESEIKTAKIILK